MVRDNGDVDAVAEFDVTSDLTDDGKTGIFELGNDLARFDHRK
jgi:hypothetical protein